MLTYIQNSIQNKIPFPEIQSDADTSDFQAIIRWIQKEKEKFWESWECATKYEFHHESQYILVPKIVIVLCNYVTTILNCNAIIANISSSIKIKGTIR